MKIGKKLGLMILTIFIFVFKIDMARAEEITCEYEMYPIGYSLENNVPYSIYSSTNNSVAIIKYNGTKKLERVSTIKQKYSQVDTFNDNDFHNKVQDSKMCPSYVYATKNNLKILDSNGFIKNSGISSSEFNYPMFLKKQNGKTMTISIKFAFNNIFNNWKTLIDNENKNLIALGCNEKITDAETYNMKEEDFYTYVDGNYENRNGIDKSLSQTCWDQRKKYVSSIKAARSFYNVLYQNSSDLTLAKKSNNWSSFYKFSIKATGLSTSVNELENKETEYKTATEDYCYFYCDSIICKNQTEGTAKDNCLKERCSSTIKQKCETAYNACKSIASSTAQTECIQTKLKENGLDPIYTDARADELKKLQEEISNLKKITNRIEKISIDYELYDIKCEDVEIFHEIWVIITILAPVLAILMGTLDFGKAVISGNEEKIKKAWGKFPKRLLAAAILWLIPLLISLVLNLTTNEQARDKNLMYCIINGGEN